MKLIPVMGYGLAMVLGGIIVQFRGAYLQRMSRKIQIDESSSFNLRPAVWAYLLPLLVLGVGIFSASLAFQSKKQLEILFAGGFSALMTCAGIWLVFRFSTARAAICENKLVYTEGRDRVEISASEVSAVSIYWFSFPVKLKSGRTILIPAKFRNSEIILAFLQRAAIQNATK